MASSRPVGHPLNSPSSHGKSSSHRARLIPPLPRISTPRRKVRTTRSHRKPWLQRRSAPCGSVANQRGSYEIDGCGQFGSGPMGVLGTLASSRLAGSLLGMDPGTRRLRLRILQTLLPRISLAALALFVKPKFRKPGKRQSHSKTSRRLPDHCPRAMATSSLAKTLRWSTSLTSLLVSVADRATHGDLCDT